MRRWLVKLFLGDKPQAEQAKPDWMDVRYELECTLEVLDDLVRQVDRLKFRNTMPGSLVLVRRRAIATLIRHGRRL